MIPIKYIFWILTIYVLAYVSFLLGIVMIGGIILTQGINNALGGWPESWYRIRGIGYRQMYIIGPDDKILRPIIRDDQLKIGSAARAEIKVGGKTGDYFIEFANDEKFANPNYRPATLHTWDDSRAIKVKNRDGGRADPFLIHNAFHNDVQERRHKLNEKPQRLKWGLFGLVIFLSFMVSALALYYTLFYGQNIACAVHSHGACP